MLVDLTKQLAQQALTSAITPEPAAPAVPAADNPGAVILNQIGAMQKALKEDEELVLHVESAGEKIRVMEIFLPSSHVAVLSGIDPNRAGARIVSAVSALQLLVRTSKVPAGTKPVRINLVMPRSGK